MTEEIVINGIDVAGCEFAVKPINDNRIRCHCVKGLLRLDTMYEQPLSAFCKNNPNCYYKQLKRLEQQHNEQHNDDTEEIAKLGLDVAILEQENKELKEMYRLSCLKCEYKNTKADVDTYRSALEEIREILLEHSCADSHSTKYITNKINEVLNADNDRL